ncbi:MAG: hypothetical protein ABIG44_09965 [Planctomycetota bacterium]
MKRSLRPTGLAALAASVIFTSASGVYADPPTTWSFDLYTEGQDVFWTSPTAVNTTGDRYYLGHEITTAVATVQYWILPPFDVDIIPYLDPADLTGSSWEDGPPPIEIYNDAFMFPEPPEPVAIAANANIILDADGYGQASITDIYFGQYDLDPFGMVDILAMRLGGTVTVRPLWDGDMNCDGIVNAYDIDAFICALSPSCDYAALQPDCDWLLADCNDDGEVNSYDIDAFIDAISGGP